MAACLFDKGIAFSVLWADVDIYEFFFYYGKPERGKKPCWCTETLREGNINGLPLTRFPLCKCGLCRDTIHAFCCMYDLPHLFAHRCGRKTLFETKLKCKNTNTRTQKIVLKEGSKRMNRWWARIEESHCRVVFPPHFQINIELSCEWEALFDFKIEYGQFVFLYLGKDFLY